MENIYLTYQQLVPIPISAAIIQESALPGVDTTGLVVEITVELSDKPSAEP